MQNRQELLIRIKKYKENEIKQILRKELMHEKNKSWIFSR